MSRTTADDQLRFLLSCVKHANAGKIDFAEVASECRIVSKGAAAKRFERLIRAIGIPGATSNRKPEESSEGRSKPNIKQKLAAKRKRIEEDEYDIRQDDGAPIKSEALKSDLMSWTPVKYESASNAGDNSLRKQFVERPKQELTSNHIINVPWYHSRYHSNQSMLVAGSQHFDQGSLRQQMSLLSTRRRGSNSTFGEYLSYKDPPMNYAYNITPSQAPTPHRHEIGGAIFHPTMILQKRGPVSPTPNCYSNDGNQSRVPVIEVQEGVGIGADEIRTLPPVPQDIVPLRASELASEHEPTGNSIENSIPILD